MAHAGWKQLLDGWPWFRGDGRFPSSPILSSCRRCASLANPSWDTLALAEDDPWGWPVTEYEEALTLRPGLHDIARHLLDKLVALCRGEEEHGISAHKLRENPYWPKELALSQTQNDKAYVR
jgi:hypothetical protein